MLSFSALHTSARPFGAARQALRALVGELRHGTAPARRRVIVAHDVRPLRQSATQESSVRLVIEAAGSGDENAIGSAIAEGTAAVLGAVGGAALRMDGRGGLIELGRWPAGPEGRPPASAWNAAERAARARLPGRGGRAPSAVVAAPILRAGAPWGAAVAWGVPDPASGVDRLRAFLELADPAVGGALERLELAERAREEAALRRIATAVASGRDLSAIDALLAEEAAMLLGADSGAVVQIDSDGRARLGATWAVPREHRRYEDAVSRALRTERPARAEGVSFAARWLAGDHGIAAPIRVRGIVRGAVTVERTAKGAFAPGDEERLVPFAELAALALVNAERREALSAEARADPLTGIGNRRAFTERLAEEVERARRYGHPISLVLMDLDGFKSVNDTFGHQVGDAVLVEAARRLTRLVRAGELVARIGGDELAWLLPETDADGAVRAAERAIDAISGTPFTAAGGLTASAGVSDLASARSPSELVRLADEALLKAKVEGPGIARRSPRHAL